MTRIELQVSGLDQMVRYLVELQNPQRLVEDDIAAILHEAFEDTQARAHVVSGALKHSGRLDISYQLGVIVGTITYGGPSSPHDVDYAIYEMARGGSHDFFAGLPEYVEKLRLANVRGLR